VQGDDLVAEYPH